MENNMHIQRMFINMQNVKYLNIQKYIRDQKRGELMFILAAGQLLLPIRKIAIFNKQSLNKYKQILLFFHQSIV